MWMENGDKTGRMNGRGNLPCNYCVIGGLNHYCLDYLMIRLRNLRYLRDAFAIN